MKKICNYFFGLAYPWLFLFEHSVLWIHFQRYFRDYVFSPYWSIAIFVALHHRFIGNIIVDGKFVGRDVDFAPDTGFIIEKPAFIPYDSGFKNLYLLASVNNSIRGGRF